MAVYSPHTERFLADLPVRKRTDPPSIFPVAISAPWRYLDLITTSTIVEYVIVTGMLEDIRKEVYDLNKKYRMNLPVFDFNGGRQGRYYRENAEDSGWPVEGMLNIHPLAVNATLWGPGTSYQSGDIKEIEIVAAIESDAGHFHSWNRIEGSEKTEQESLEIDIVPGAGSNTYRIDTRELPGFRGLITGIALEFL